MPHAHSRQYGVSAYFRHLDVAEEVCATAREDGFSYLFGSLHVPEEPEGDFGARMRRVGELAQRSGLKLVVDISGPSLESVGLDVDTAGAMRDWGVHALRVDYGISMPDIVRLSHAIPVWFNASTATRGDFETLVEMGMRTDEVGISHNFFPKPWTGLDDAFVAEQTAMFHEFGFAVQAFVPGDGVLRIPVGHGLPTLERHRDLHPVAAALDLHAFGVDDVFVGDPSLSERTRRAWRAFVVEDVVELEVRLTADVPAAVREQLRRVDRNRTDAAAAMVRLESARGALADATIPATGARARPAGSVTVDNDGAGRYKGEIALQKVDIPADPTVNVVGHVVEEDRALLERIGPGRRVRLRLTDA
ncbi:MupG family TIM beta-alpha barrel fold protein [Georgenia faecalis]|uniref:MupG family TIM beta-alpha barrel fold protein n=1 Tax=Georgenia faecalis TaxID=2483799 RepID=UPI000FD7B62B|nr:MupG family TIM beta-alpha barrel fold protein [Georgenia faecalis]